MSEIERKELQTKPDTRDVGVQIKPDCQEVAVQRSPDIQEVAVQTQSEAANAEKNGRPSICKYDKHQYCQRSSFGICFNRETMHAHSHACTFLRLHSWNTSDWRN